MEKKSCPKDSNDQNTPKSRTDANHHKNEVPAANEIHQNPFLATTPRKNNNNNSTTTTPSPASRCSNIIVEKPRIQQTESDERISIALDVSGYTISDLHIDVTGRVLTIAGRRQNRIGMEFAFSRRLGLKMDRLNMETLRADLVENVLEVTVEKKKAVSTSYSRVIPISVGDSADNDTSNNIGSVESDKTGSGVVSADQQTGVEATANNNEEEATSATTGSEGDESVSSGHRSSNSVATPVETVSEQDEDDGSDIAPAASPQQQEGASRSSSRVNADDDETTVNLVDSVQQAEASNKHNDNNTADEKKKSDGEKLGADEKEWEDVVDMFGDRH